MTETEGRGGARGLDVKLLFSRPKEKYSFNYRSISRFNLFSTGSFSRLLAPSSCCSMRSPHASPRVHSAPARRTRRIKLKAPATAEDDYGGEKKEKKFGRDRNRHEGLTRAGGVPFDTGLSFDPVRRVRGLFIN